MKKLKKETYQKRKLIKNSKKSIFSERTSGYFYFTLFRLFEFSIGSLMYLIKDNIKIYENKIYS